MILKSLLTVLSFTILISCKKNDSSTSNQNNNTNGNANSWTEIFTINNELGTSSKIIYSSCIDNNNNYYLAGTLFSGLDGYFVAKFNGVLWSKVGTGSNALNANNYITNICTDKIGNIFATGNFTNTNGKKYIAKWNGNNWTNIGNIETIVNDNRDFVVSSIICNSNNVLYISVYANFLDQRNPIQLYKFNGTLWEKQGRTIMKNSTTNIGSPALTIDNNNNVFFVGDSLNASQAGISYIAKWNGTIWQFSNGPNNYILNGVNALYATQNNNLYCLTLSNAATPSVLNWNNVIWQEIGLDVNYFTSYVSFFPFKSFNSDNNGTIYISRKSNNDGKEYASKLVSGSWNNVGANIPTSGAGAISQIDIDNNGKIYIVRTDGNLGVKIFQLMP